METVDALLTRGSEPSACYWVEKNNILYFPNRWFKDIKTVEIHHHHPPTLCTFSHFNFVPLCARPEYLSLTLNDNKLGDV